MIVNIRGTNGSGKTTVINGVLSKFKPVPIYGLMGPRKPEAYRLDRGKKKPLFVIGPYDGTPTSGVDNVSTKGLEALIELLAKYDARGHVLFEGAMISTNVGLLGYWLADRKERVVIAQLDTSVEDCFAGVASRRRAAGHAEKTPIHLAGHWDTIKRACVNLTTLGVCVKPISRSGGAAMILGWIEDSEG